MNEEILKLIVAEQTDSLSADQKAELNDWRSENHSKEEAYQAMVKLWQEAGQVDYHSSYQKARDWEVISETIRAQKQTATNWLPRIAATISLLLVAGILIYQFYLSPYAGYTAYEAVSDIHEVALADGSIITLNEGSELWVSEGFNGDDRSVMLEGEAYFEVAKNEELPFVIEGGESVTRVVGTAFNLLVGEATAELTVTEGQVAFGSSSETIPVGAGESAVHAEGDKPSMMQHNLNRLSWKTGQLRFDDAPLQQVCSDVGKHYGADFIVAPEVANMKFTSQYDHARLEEVLNELELILGLDIRLNNTTYQVNPK